MLKSRGKIDVQIKINTLIYVLLRGIRFSFDLFRVDNKSELKKNQKFVQSFGGGGGGGGGERLVFSLKCTYIDRFCSIKGIIRNNTLKRLSTTTFKHNRNKFFLIEIHLFRNIFKAKLDWVPSVFSSYLCQDLLPSFNIFLQHLPYPLHGEEKTIKGNIEGK